MNAVVMNFSGVYGLESFWRSDASEIDCSKISGTDCYLDSFAEREIRRKMEAFPLRGIHFVDSGNTHYMSKLWTDRISEKFSLIVFDHHSDMQPPAFDGILSCGSWLKDALDSNPFLQNVLLVGVGESSAAEIGETYQEKVRIVLEREVSDEAFADKFSFPETIFRHPVYVSVDKDVLAEKELKTNWDGGSLSVRNLFQLLEKVFSRGEVLGVDICGEPFVQGNFSDVENLEQSNSINARLLKFLKDRF